MENIVINIHEDNLSIFNEKLKELNEKFSKKNLPLINCSMEKTEMYHVDEWTKEKTPYTMYVATLSSDFNQTNLSGVDVEFEGVVSLVESNENDKVFTFKNINYSSLLANCSCDKCHKKIGRNKYLVFSKVGKEVETRDDLVVLGTSCAKDYFPFSIESYFGYLESAFEELGSYDEFNGSFGGCASHYHTLSAIYYATLATTDNLKCYEKEGVTKGNVLGWLNNLKMDKYTYYRDAYPIPSNPIPFEDVISWVKDMYDTDKFVSDFHTNARSVFFKTLDDGTREMRNEIMAKSTNYRGIHISIRYEYGYDYYEIREINKGKKWNDVTLFSTLKEAKQYIDDHYDELVELCNVKESKSSTRKSIKESYLDEVTNLYFFDLDVDEECEVRLENFVMPCRISQFYKNDRHMYLIVQSKTSDEIYFVITYNYKKNKFVSSKVFSSYREAKNQLVDTIAMVF